MKNAIDPNWISWAKRQVTFLKDGGYLIFPNDGAIFQLNKASKTLTLVCCVPSWIGSKVEDINRQVFSKIQYRYDRPDDVPTSPEVMIDKLFANLQKYSSDIPTLIHGVGIIFKLKRENESQDDKVLQLIAKKGKKLPINPVTVRGDGNFTAGRLWIGVNTVPDTAHRFNPSVQRGPRWDKPVTILLWKEGQSLDVNDSNRPAMIVDEADYIQFVKSLKSTLSGMYSHDAQIKLWGQANRVDEHQKMFAIFSDTNDSRLKVELYKTNDDYTEQTLVGTATLEFEEFLDGMGHLFPNGELS